MALEQTYTTVRTMAVEMGGDKETRTCTKQIYFGRENIPGKLKLLQFPSIQIHTELDTKFGKKILY